MNRKRGRLGYVVVRCIFLFFILVTITLILLFNTNSARLMPFHIFDLTSTLATNGAQQWNGDNTITPPIMNFSSPSSTTLSVSPPFASTYKRYNTSTANSLGTPITTGIPTSYGWLQLFTFGALLLPSTPHTPTQQTSDSLATLASHGMRDTLTGVLRLPLLAALLTAGSSLPLTSVDTSLTYADLRKATDPALMQPAPPDYETVRQRSTASYTLQNSLRSQAIFIQTGTRGGRAVGHVIPATIWNYLHQPGVAPDGWEHDFGPPLTEALTFTLPPNTQTHQVHHMLLQAFAYNVVAIDQDVLQPNAQPSPESLLPIQTGIDYLRTYGLPRVAIQAQQHVWVQGDAVLLDAASTGHALAHVGQNFPLTLLGTTTWIGNMLWYRVQWSQLKSIQDGWISGASITLQSPDDTTPASASFDVLSTKLATYLASLDATAGVVVYDVSYNTYYTYNGSNPFLSASSIKVPIMLTFLDMVEQQGREPDDDEMNLLTTMIENSNNDSASALYFNSINGSQGINSYMRKIGVSGVSPDDDAWGYSTITPQAMVSLLALLQSNKILNSTHRALALNLMENVESDQQIGVGDTAPPNATVALKDGWVTDPDNLWAVNSSGIVSTSNETYIIAVYTQQIPSLDNGQTILHTLCNTLASLLTSRSSPPTAPNAVSPSL